MNKIIVIALLLATCLIVPDAVIGAEIGEIQWHGFLTSAMLITHGAGHDVYYAGGVSDDGSFEDTRLGLNLTTRIDESWDLTAQMKALGVNDFAMEVDWAYASYRPSDSTVLRFGRVKYPVGLVNEYVDVGYTYPWIRPPEAIYSRVVVGPDITHVSYNGAEASVRKYIRNGEFDFDFIGGYADVPDGHIDDLVGTKFRFSINDEIRFELSGTTGVMDIKDENSPRYPFSHDKHNTTYTAGIMVDKQNFLMYTEYAKASMGDKIMDTKSGYVTLGYRIGYYLPHITYERWEAEGGWGQKSIIVGLRRELTNNSALKLEVHRIAPNKTQKPPCTTDVATGELVCTGGVWYFEGQAMKEV